MRPITTRTSKPPIMSILITFISDLRASGGPSAIFRSVIAVIVDSIKSQFFVRWMAHICQEILKFVPALAYHNASTTIAVIASSLRIVAPLNHASPNPISPGLAQQMAGIGAIRPTSAGLNPAISQRSRLHSLFCPAQATAKPVIRIATPDGSPIVIFFSWGHLALHWYKFTTNDRQ